MYGQVVAIGPFHATLRDVLYDPAARHLRTAEGSIVVEPVFATPEGNSRSRELAGCFGVDPWDFGAHALDAERADLDRLRAMFRHDAPAAADKFVRLRAAGFRFFFLPNG
jgi:hypothetical protein